ncbi:MAG: hypothetical protein ACQETI_12115 [Halobacteriota archaeon]
MSTGERGKGSATDSGGPSRREVLRSVGVAGTALSVPHAGEPVRSLSLGERGGGPSPAVEAVAALDLSDVRTEPVVGNCRDLFGQDATCGLTTMYEDGVTHELGSHSFELTFDGMPVSSFDGDFDPGSWATKMGTVFDRVPEPPASDPDFGPYDLIVNGDSLEFGADHDLVALDWHATCEVTPDCRDRWCAAFEQTITDLRNSVEDAETAIDLANARLAGEVFSVSVPHQSAESGSVAALEAQIEAAVLVAMREIHDDWKRLQHERIQEERAADDRVDVDEARLCEACSDCDASPPQYDRVEAWELRVFETVDATAEWEDDGDPAEGWARHELRARVALERVDPFKDLVGEVDGFLDTILGILSFLAGLFGDDDGGQYLWTSTEYEATAWKNAGWRVTADDGSTIARTNNAQSLGSGVLDPEVELSIDTRADEYTLSFPTVYVEGFSTFTTPDHVGSSEYSEAVGFGDLIALRAAGVDLPGFDDVDDPDFDLDPEQFEEPSWSLEDDADDCSLRIESDVEFALNGEGIDPSVIVYGNDPEGTARLRWELAPLQLADDIPAQRIGCP